MKCRVCGSTLRASITDLPFKVSDRTIVIVKNLPVEQCEACAEYPIADTAFAKTEVFGPAAGHGTEPGPGVGVDAAGRHHAFGVSILAVPQDLMERSR